MIDLLLTPSTALALMLGALLGGLAVAAALCGGYRAAERRLALEAQLTRERARAAEQARAWQRAGAANDDAGIQRSARADLRGGPR